eukprot:jgi/Mesvir1/15521/Mv03173-RA.1
MVGAQVFIYSARTQIHIERHEVHSASWAASRGADRAAASASSAQTAIHLPENLDQSAKELNTVAEPDNDPGGRTITPRASIAPRLRVRDGHRASSSSWDGGGRAFKGQGQSRHGGRPMGSSRGHSGRSSQRTPWHHSSDREPSSTGRPWSSSSNGHGASSLHSSMVHSDRREGTGSSGRARAGGSSATFLQDPRDEELTFDQGQEIESALDAIEWQSAQGGGSQDASSGYHRYGRHRRKGGGGEGTNPSPGAGEGPGHRPGCGQGGGGLGTGDSGGGGDKNREEDETWDNGGVGGAGTGMGGGLRQGGRFANASADEEGEGGDGEGEDEGEGEGEGDAEADDLDDLFGYLLRQERGQAQEEGGEGEAAGRGGYGDAVDAGARAWRGDDAGAQPGSRRGGDGGGGGGRRWGEREDKGESEDATTGSGLDMTAESAGSSPGGQGGRPWDLPGGGDGDSSEDGGDPMFTKGDGGMGGGGHGPGGDNWPSARPGSGSGSGSGSSSGYGGGREDAAGNAGVGAGVFPGNDREGGGGTEEGVGGSGGTGEGRGVGRPGSPQRARGWGSALWSWSFGRLWGSREDADVRDKGSGAASSLAGTSGGAVPWAASGGEAGANLDGFADKGGGFDEAGDGDGTGGDIDGVWGSKGTGGGRSGEGDAGAAGGENGNDGSRGYVDAGAGGVNGNSSSGSNGGPDGGSNGGSNYGGSGSGEWVQHPSRVKHYPHTFQGRLWAGFDAMALHVRVGGPFVNASMIRARAWGPRAPLALIMHRKQFMVPTGSLRGGNNGMVDYFDVEPEPGVTARLHFDPAFVSYLPMKDVAWQYKTCAVVGNSGTLLKHAFGRAIDSADAVFRINYAPTHGYERHAGTKTTFDIINQQHTKAFVPEVQAGGSLPSSKRASWRNSYLVVFEVTSPFARQHLYLPLLKKFNEKHKAGPVIVLSSDFVVEAHRAWSLVKRLVEAAAYSHHSYLQKPMSGFFAVYFALQICEEVHLYGFSPYRKGERVHYHYFDSVAAVTASHSFDLAYVIFRQLSQWPGLDAVLRIHPED